jgi:hypothetical protein
MNKITFLLLLCSASTWAAGPFTKVDPKCSLPANSQGDRDPFDPSIRFARGPNKGKCADTRVVRTVVPLSPQEQNLYQIPVPQGSVSVANFSDQNGHYIAVIDPSGVEDAIFQIEDFPAIVPAAHNQIRFKMKPGSEVLLYSQIVDAEGRPTSFGPVRRLREFAFSGESVSPAGEDYNVFLGMQGHYGLGYRLVSMADKYATMVLELHHKVRQIRLNMTAEQKVELFKNAYALAAENGMASEYKTLSASCMTEDFRAIDRTIPPSANQNKKIHTPVGWLGQTYPVLAETGLSIRGLVKPDGSSELPRLDQDLELIEELEQGY